MTIKKKCPICNKTAEVNSESKVGNLIIINYACGHVRAKRIPTPKDMDVTSRDGKKPFPYQLEDAARTVKSNGRVLLAHEMGVGKTLIAELACKSDPSEYLPVLIVCKPGLKTQILSESFRWCGWVLQTIENENDFILQGLPGYIIGYETLAHSSFTNKRGKVITRGIKDLSAFMDKINPRTIILDECQQIKNKEARRTRAVQEIARKPEHVIALSGTPIENNMKEYFPILNILYPDKFYSESAYIARWGDSYVSSGGYLKVGGIKDIEGFKNYTKDFIIRRTRAEVLPDLPTVDRRFRFEELGAKVEEAYKEEFKKFQDFYYYGDPKDKDVSIIAYLNKMRHLTGIAKIPGVVEFTEEFINSTGRKLVIFTHHIDVAKEVTSRIEALGIKVIYAPSPVDPKLIDDFRDTLGSVVLVGNTLSLGTGFNLQCCSECIQMEPEWSPLKEEQAEGRFPRPGQTSDKITATSFIAVGTVDEFFSELKEQKRAYFASAMDHKEVKWNESSLIKELAEVLAQKGGKKWGW